MAKPEKTGVKEETKASKNGNDTTEDAKNAAANSAALKALWESDTLDEISLSRSFFKPDEVPVGTIMYGYLTGCEEMKTKFGDAKILVFRLAMPAPCWVPDPVEAGKEETGHLEVKPAGTEVLFVMNEKLKSLENFAYVPDVCIDIAIKVDGKIKTAKHEMHTFTMKVGKNPIARVQAMSMGAPEGVKRLIQAAADYQARAEKQLAAEGA